MIERTGSAASLFRCRVIFGDTDAGGIVYHPRYLEMAERGRSELMRALGLDVGVLFAHRNLGLALRSAVLKFHAPAVYDDWLSVRTAVERLGAASSIWVSHIRRGGSLLCVARVEIVCIDRLSRQPVVYPEEVLRVFRLARNAVAGPSGKEAS